MRRKRRLAGAAGGVCVAVALSLAAAPSAASAATPWMVGAASADTTPPAFDPAQDLIDFPEVDPASATVCPRSVYNGPRRWRFEEPYIDTDSSGDFNYPLSSGPVPVPAPEPFCDYNHNGRWDGIYSSGGIAVQPVGVHDPIDVRAIALSDGTHTVIVASVVAQGLHGNYLDVARALAESKRPGIGDVVISADHNESSPDTVGIYGAPDLGGAAGANSGIDEYYYAFLERRISDAAVAAYDAMRPASLLETEFRLPSDLEQELSKNFPTTNDDGSPAAVDPKVRVLQARDAGGAPIFTMANLAAHNQEIGHGQHTDQISSDWPGYMKRKLDTDLGGTGIFLVGDNGSEEDLKTVPRVSPCESGCFAQAQATGDRLASVVESHLSAATPLRFGPVSSRRDVFDVPLENNVFRAAAVAGLFGQRQLYTAGQPTGRTGPDLQTQVGVVDVGPDLQFLANPGEAFPALILGSPWGIDDPDNLGEDVGCPGRPNPSVPNWHASATHRFQIGLADDMIGYEIPAWAFTEVPGIFVNQPPNLDGCANDVSTGLDPAGHQHKLETEGVGPSASNAVADHLTALLDAEPDPAAEIRLGRFVMPDGSLSRRAHDTRSGQDAVAVWLADPGSTSLSPGTGTIVSIGDVGGFGARQADAFGAFMDYDGASQGAPDITTRGMLVPGGDGAVTHRYYVDVYPSLARSTLGAATVAPEPAAAIADAAPTHAGANVSASFEVTLSAKTGRTAQVDWATEPGDAVAGTDFAASSGTLTFSPNDTSETVTVPVLGGAPGAADRHFSVQLSNPVNTTIADDRGEATVIESTAGGGGSGGAAGPGAATEPGSGGAVTKTCRRHRRHHHHRRHCRRHRRHRRR